MESRIIMDERCVTVFKEKKKRKKKEETTSTALRAKPMRSSMARNDESERKSDLYSRSRIERCLCVRHFVFVLPLSVRDARVRRLILRSAFDISRMQQKSSPDSEKVNQLKFRVSSTFFFALRTFLYFSAKITAVLKKHIQSIQ